MSRAGSDGTFEISQRMIVEAIRCWEAAKKSGLARQPRLYQTLADYRLEILAPAFDSLMTIFEAAMKRPIIVGTDCYPSADESVLIGMLVEPGNAENHFCRSEEELALLVCALRSIRLMIDCTVTVAPDDHRYEN